MPICLFHCTPMRLNLALRLVPSHLPWVWPNQKETWMWPCAKTPLCFSKMIISPNTKALIRHRSTRISCSNLCKINTSTVVFRLLRTFKIILKITPTAPIGEFVRLVFGFCTVLHVLACLLNLVLYQIRPKKSF